MGMNVKEIYRTVRDAVLSVPIMVTLAVAPVYAGDVGKANYRENTQKTETVESKNIGKVARRFIREYNGEKVLDIEAYGRYLLEKNPVGEPIDDYRIPREVKEYIGQLDTSKTKCYWIRILPMSDPITSHTFYRTSYLEEEAKFWFTTYIDGVPKQIAIIDKDADGLIDSIPDL